MREGIAHLLVDVRPGSTLVGPLVLPGRSACLSCVDRFRTDRDPRWPLVVAQLSAPHLVAADLVSATVAGALAAMQVLLFVDGDRPTTVNAVIDVALPDATTSWRSVDPHPACGCNWSADASNG
jgi:bacteriocin biosynthesis cyclodehydratase domain-containing protein